MSTPKPVTARLLLVFVKTEYPSLAFVVRFLDEDDPARVGNFACDCITITTADGATPDLAMFAVVNAALLHPQTAWLREKLVYGESFLNTAALRPHDLLTAKEIAELNEERARDGLLALGSS